MLIADVFNLVDNIISEVNSHENKNLKIKTEYGYIMDKYTRFRLKEHIQYSFIIKDFDRYNFSRILECDDFHKIKNDIQKHSFKFNYDTQVNEALLQEFIPNDLYAEYQYHEVSTGKITINTKNGKIIRYRKDNVLTEYYVYCHNYKYDFKISIIEEKDFEITSENIEDLVRPVGVSKIIYNRVEKKGLFHRSYYGYVDLQKITIDSIFKNSLTLYIDPIHIRDEKTLKHIMSELIGIRL